ncbi:DUF1254 domain-containing protein [Microbulbifer salipaludis]|uniref:DUF1254 domain-containing protein n=1 Tax=Microbulbifer salipaludis TaxID=187980 RepID=A0ABS3E8N7_9GAMM|nr:DUF1254 domain-containing protein [Microbulbifer salipaludis]MBN8431671.1 DUF1254 domain-containing protein [Microbulbifer salipaludis]
MMRYSNWTVVILALLLAAGCGGGKEERAEQQVAATDTGQAAGSGGESVGAGSQGATTGEGEAPEGGVTIETRIGKLSFTHDFANGYPTDETKEKLFDEMDFQRATQAYIWAIPIVSFAQWQHEHENVFKAKSGDIVHYPDYVSKLGLLTANTTTPYALSFIRLNETGPIVVEMPEAKVRGAVHSMWQIAIAPMTEPGKYVFYAPGTEKPDVPADYKVFESPTNSVFFGIRLMSKDEEERRDALSKIEIYPLANEGSAADTTVIEAGDTRWAGWQPRGITYFERLADILNREPVDERDRFFHAMLKPLGIEKGKPFKPDARQKEILTEAALVGEAMAKANDFENPRLEQSIYKKGSHWEIATVSPPDQRWEHYDSLDGRAAWFYEAVTNDPAMQSKTPGKDQIYLAAYKDSDNDWLDGANQYRLHIPPNAPAAEFWSTTVYDVSTRAPIDNKQRLADKSSRMDLIKNDDGSIDIYFGPTSPPGKEKNWIPTVPGRAWFTYFRFYSPTEAYFDKSWLLPDIDKASW